MAASARMRRPVTGERRSEAQWRSAVHPDRIEGIGAFNEDRNKDSAMKNRLLTRRPARNPRPALSPSPPAVQRAPRRR
jgi:hypothetical protein